LACKEILGRVSNCALMWRDFCFSLALYSVAVTSFENIVDVRQNWSRLVASSSYLAYWGDFRGFLILADRYFDGRFFSCCCKGGI